MCKLQSIRHFSVKSIVKETASQWLFTSQPWQVQQALLHALKFPAELLATVGLPFLLETCPLSAVTGHSRPCSSTMCRRPHLGSTAVLLLLLSVRNILSAALSVGHWLDAPALSFHGLGKGVLVCTVIASGPHGSLSVMYLQQAHNSATQVLGWDWSSVVEHFPSMCEAWSLIPNTASQQLKCSS